jgi:hypothetical protein
VVGAWRTLKGTYWPALLVFAGIVLVMLFLFAYPLVSGALAFALPFATMAVMASMFLGMNLRWSLSEGGRPLFFSIADFGFLLCAGAFAVYGFAYVSDYGWNLPYVLIGLGIIAMFRVGFIEFEAWWLGIVLCALLGLVFGAYVRLTLFEPAWFFDFSASLLLLTGILLLLGGSVLLLLEGPGGSRRETWPAWLKASVIVLGLVLAVTLAVSATATVTNRETVAASGGPGMILATYEAGRLEFSRDFPAEGTVRVLIVNEDLRVHSLTSEALGVDVLIGPKSERIVEAVVSTEDYGFVCRIPGHSERGRVERN